MEKDMRSYRVFSESVAYRWEARQNYNHGIGNQRLEYAFNKGYWGHDPKVYGIPNFLLK